MPIASGAMGRPGILAIPGFSPRRGRPFRSPALYRDNPKISGITRDSAGVALASCVVQLFRTADDAIMGETTSGADGSYSIAAVGTGPFYIVAYKAGAPDVAGTTANTLQAE